MYRTEPYVRQIPSNWECLNWSPEELSKTMGEYEIQGRIASDEINIKEEHLCRTVCQPLKKFLAIEDKIWERFYSFRLLGKIVRRFRN